MMRMFVFFFNPTVIAVYFHQRIENETEDNKNYNFLDEYK